MAAWLLGALLLLIDAFRVSVLWGLGILLFPFMALVFAVMHWDVARRAVLLQLAALAVAMVVASLTGKPA